MSQMSQMRKKMTPPPSPVVENQEMSPETDQESTLGAMTDPKQAQSASPELMEKLKKMQTIVIHLMYSKDTKQQMKKLLSGGEYAYTIPTATKTLYKNIRMILNKKGTSVTLEDKLAIALTIFSELLELGTAMGLVPQDIPEDEQESMLRAALQDEIKEGLANGDIDPIELQEAIEPLLPQDFRDEGQRIAQGKGLEQKPSQQMINMRLKDEAARPFKVENERLKEQTNKQQTALKGFGQVASGQPQGGAV